MRAAHVWADANLPVARTACLIAPENAGSVNVARKCGYGKPEIGTFRDADVLIMRREGPARRITRKAARIGRRRACRPR